MRWVTGIIVMLLVSSTLGAASETMVEPANGNDVMQEAPMMEAPMMEGQDYIEPGVTPVMSRDKAVELAMEALATYLQADVTQGNFQLNTEYRKDWQYPDRYVWSLYWYLNDPMKYVNANVTLDAATGEILEMNHDKGSYTETTLPQLTLTREEAQAIAMRFIEKIMPGKLSEMVLRDHQAHYGGPYQYAFNYVRQIDDIVYDANFVTMTIDGSTGAIRWFSQRWEDAPTLPEAKGLLSKEEAVKKFGSMNKMELFYLPIRSEFMYEPIPNAFRLAYRMDPAMGTMLNAKTGQLVDWNGQDGSASTFEKDLSSLRKSEIAQQAEPVEMRQQPMEQLEAESLARQYVTEMLAMTIQIQASNYMEGDQYWESAGRKTWNIDFTVTETSEQEGMDSEQAWMPGQSNGRVMVNAMTGELIALNWWHYVEGPYGNSGPSVISWEEGYAIAIEGIATYHPEKINQVRTMQRYFPYHAGVGMDQPAEYYYHFPRVIDDVIFDENHISVGVNAQTGQIINYTDRWMDGLTLPQQNNIINIQEALDKLLANYLIELAYFRYNATNDYMNPTYDTKLVYRWMPDESAANYPYIDAASGQLVDYNGRSMSEGDPKGFETRIKGHWIQRTAHLMAQQGIIDTMIFAPDEPIQKMDLIKMMVKARGTDAYGYGMDMASEKVEYIDVPETDEDHRYIQWAIRYGYIDNLPEAFQREAIITREETAGLMVRFMGYQTLSEAEGIFQVQYEDASEVSTEALGAVAINQGLGIAAPGGFFRPTETTTMAEAADMLFKAVAQQRR